MKLISLFTLIFLCQLGYGQVVLDADGPGETYELISSILAPGYNPIEVPDCNHMEFGEHIDEVFDSTLNIHVFRFHIHTTPDDDRCIKFDRQRNEIKSYDKSPDNLLGIENEKVVYKWKFKLPSGFQSSPNFTHLHQLKSVGGSLASMPMYTLTARKGTPDQLELRYAKTSSQVTLQKTDLAPFIGSWLEVTETIGYGVDGNYKIEIKKVADDSILFAYANGSIVNWRPGAEFVRPKWGIYRGLINAQDLRDEMVLFANFSIEEIGTTSIKESNINKKNSIVSNPAYGSIFIKEVPLNTEHIQLYNSTGNLVLTQQLEDLLSEITIDVSSLPSGKYILKLGGKKHVETHPIIIVK